MNDWPRSGDPGRGGAPRGQVPPGRRPDPRRQPPARQGGSAGDARRRDPYSRNPQPRSELDRARDERRGTHPSERQRDRYDERPRPSSSSRPSSRARSGPPPASTSSRVVGLRIGRAVLAIASAITLIALGISWSATNGISTANVIDPNAQNDTGDENILLVGLDNRTDAQGNPLPQSLLDELHAGDQSDGGDNTDTIILIHIPAGGGQAVAFSIPRDSYVQLAGGYGMHKINSAYTYAEVAAQKQLKGQGISGPQLAVQSDQAGAQNAIHTIQNLTGLSINHFASVNLAGFYSISQAIGGVPVCLKAAVHDSYSGADFPAGPQTIEGAQALAFVRQRHGLPLGDLDRIRRQQAFMASMAHTVLSAGVLTNTTKLSNLVDALKQSVTIDQGWDIFSFAQQMQSMSGGNIQFQTIPIITETYPTKSDGDAVEVNPTQVQQFISSTIQSQGATSTTAAPPPSSAANNSSSGNNNAKVTVEVLNGGGKTGLAVKVLNVLTGKGFTAGTTGNTASRTTSVVEYGSGGSAGAQSVAAALGGLTTESSSSLAAGAVRVLIGSKYTGPTSDTATSSGGSTSTGGGSTSTTPDSPQGATPAITANGVTCVD